MKSGTTELLKFKKLQRRLGLKVWECAGLLEMLWFFTLRNAPEGDIGKHSNEDIAAYIEWDRDADELVKVLTDTGWIDVSEDHRLIVHDWHEHAPNHLKGGLKHSGRSFASQQEQAKPVAKPVAIAGSQASSSEIPATKPSLVKSSLVKSSQTQGLGDFENSDSAIESFSDTFRQTLPPDAPLVSLPDVLDVPAFREAWQAWCVYLTKEKRIRYAQTTMIEHLKELARAGPTSAIKMLALAKSKGGINPYELRDEKKTNGEKAETTLQKIQRKAGFVPK